MGMDRMLLALRDYELVGSSSCDEYIKSDYKGSHHVLTVVCDSWLAARLLHGDSRRKVIKVAKLEVVLYGPLESCIG